jgi:maleamate amidohydrolase
MTKERNMPVWDKFLTERDKAVFSASGYGVRQGFGKRPALLVIDVSYGFTGDKREPIRDAIDVIKSLAETFRTRKLPVIYTTGVVRPDNWDAGSWAWKNTRTAEAAPRPTNKLDANEIVAELAPQPQDVVVYKQKPSGFHGSNLLSYLILLGCDSVIVTGTTTSGCVRATVIDAFSNNFRVSVVEDGCFDRSQASHAVSLCDMNAKYADVLPSSEALAFATSHDAGLFPNLPEVR